MKTTKAQALPWKKCTLGDVIKLQRGFDLPGRLRRAGQIPIVSSSGITDYHQIAAANGPGVVTGRYGTIGEVFYVEGDYWPLNTTLYVKDFKGNSPLFISHLLKTVDFASHSGKSGVPGVNRNDLHELEISLPSLTEQNAIASALSDMDALLAKLDQLIAKKRDIKQAAMQELLTGRRRLPGFDRKWEQHPLGKMLIERPTYGINAPAVPYSLSLPTYIRITDITDDGKFSSANPASVSHPSWAEYKLCEGDIVLARTGASTGKSYRYKKSDGTLIYAGFLIKIRPDAAQLNPAFLECHLNSTEYWKWVQQTSMRSGQPGINGNEYARLSIPLPSIEEQTAIASILMEMGEEVTALEARREKTRLIKQGMMQELLSGRVRLI